MTPGEIPRVPPESSPSCVPDSGDEIQIELQCYEGPEGRGPGAVSITEEALKRHVFVAGATGAGKTTLLRGLMRQLIAARPVGHRKVGLVVFDFKGDNTIEFVRSAAADAGRLNDVRVLSLEAPSGYDFFAGCRSLGDVAEYAQRLTYGSGRVENNDNFWDQARNELLAAALTWLVLNHADDRSFASWISHASSWLLADAIPAELRDDLELLRQRCEEMPVGTPERIATQRALQLIDGWEPGGHDHRTRANIKAVVSLAIGPLLEPSVIKLMRDTPEHRFRIASAVEHGRIMVVSIPAMQHPELASLVARCVKADFYRAVFTRRPGGRLVMLIGDEFHLAVTAGNIRYDDCHALPLMRSQNAGVVAATQTLAGVDRMIGNLNRKVLLGNFGTVFFLRSTEPEVEAWAHQVCGSVEVEITERIQMRDTRSDGGLMESYDRSVTHRVRRPVCIPGSLARLAPGQAYVLQEGAPPSRFPLWFAGGP